MQVCSGTHLVSCERGPAPMSHRHHASSAQSSAGAGSHPTLKCAVYDPPPIFHVTFRDVVKFCLPSEQAGGQPFAKTRWEHGREALEGHLTCLEWRREGEHTLNEQHKVKGLRQEDEQRTVLRRPCIRGCDCGESVWCATSSDNVGRNYRQPWLLQIRHRPPPPSLLLSPSPPPPPHLPILTAVELGRAPLAQTWTNLVLEPNPVLSWVQILVFRNLRLRCAAPPSHTQNW